MNTNEYSLQIVKELERTLSRVDASIGEEIVDRIIDANRVFIAGAGRSQLMLRGFAMRLMHLGLTAYVMGETVTPAIEKGDLLIIGSGSGETTSLVKAAEKAKSLGVELVLITIFSDSSIGKIADTILRVNAPTSKADSEFTSIQPGGSCFEQSMLLICDATVLRVAEKLKLDANENLKLRHANLE
jgi:6-phospho-3-hexuloisomerase